MKYGAILKGDQVDAEGDQRAGGGFEDCRGEGSAGPPLNVLAGCLDHELHKGVVRRHGFGAPRIGQEPIGQFEVQGGGLGKNGGTPGLSVRGSMGRSAFRYW
jgi:hypothetical protein